MKYKLLTIGSDPEVAIYDKKAGKYKFAGSFIPGTKDEPYFISDNGHSIQTDNTMAEFTIPPCTNAVQMNKEINYCMGSIAQRIPENLIIKTIASAYYEDEELSNPQAKEFGCDPDFNAWTCEINPKPNPNGNLRSCGGHIHIGFERDDDQPNNFDDITQMVRMCDIFLGIPSIVFDNNTESRLRRNLYGKAGAYRMKDYGVEYRSLSNFFVGNKYAIRWIFNAVKAGFKFLNEGNVIDENGYAGVPLIINNGNIKQAKAWIKNMNLPVIEIPILEEIAA